MSRVLSCLSGVEALRISAHESVVEATHDAITVVRGRIARQNPFADGVDHLLEDHRCEKRPAVRREEALIVVELIAARDRAEAPQFAGGACIRRIGELSDELFLKLCARRIVLLPAIDPFQVLFSLGARFAPMLFDQKAVDRRAHFAIRAKPREIQKRRAIRETRFLLCESEDAVGCRPPVRDERRANLPESVVFPLFPPARRSRTDRRTRYVERSAIRHGEPVAPGSQADWKLAGQIETRRRRFSRPKALRHGREDVRRHGAVDQAAVGYRRQKFEPRPQVDPGFQSIQSNLGTCRVSYSTMAVRGSPSTMRAGIVTRKATVRSTRVAGAAMAESAPPRSAAKMVKRRMSRFIAAPSRATYRAR